MKRHVHQGPRRPAVINDPFITGDNPITGGDLQAVCAEDRIAMVRRFTRAQCMDALALRDGGKYLQATVCAAIARRLRELERKALAAPMTPEKLRQAGAL